MQFAYRANRYTEDARAPALHMAQTLLECQRRFVRLLFEEFSSAFSTITLSRLATKLMVLCLSQLACHWIKAFLTEHSQRVKVGPNFSSTLRFSTSSPQRWVLSPLFYTLTHMTAPLPTLTTLSSSSLMTQLWWDSSQGGAMSQHTGMKSKGCQCDAQRIR